MRSKDGGWAAFDAVTVIDSSVSDLSALGSSDRAARETFAGILDDFQGEESAGDFPYGRAGKDLWNRISPGLTPPQIERFAASIKAFLAGCATEIRTKLRNEVPDYERCMAVRQDSFGCDFIELMTEYGAAVDMSEVLPDLSEVHLHGRRQMIIVNDLLSWRKEHAQDDRMTAVRVLIDREGLGLQEAVDHLCVLVDHHERAYIDARDRVLNSSLGRHTEVRTYLSALDHVIGGSQEFEYLTPRYFGDGFVWDGSTSGWISLDAPRTRFTPEPP